MNASPDAAISRLEKMDDDLGSVETTAHLQRLLEETIAETRLLIAHIEAGNLPRADRRRALWKARSQLGKLECAAELLRRSMKQPQETATWP